MRPAPLLPKHWPGLGLLAVALAAFALVFATSSAAAAGAHSGAASLTEDAANAHRVTLVGRIAR